MASNLGSKAIKLQSKAAELQVYWLKAKACEASKYVAKKGCSYYKQLMEQNKQYVQHPADAEKCNILAKQLFYTRLASIPIRYELLGKEVEQLKQLAKNVTQMKVEHYGLAALFSFELSAWFWAGEVIGRGFTLTGYYV